MTAFWILVAIVIGLVILAFVLEALVAAHDAKKLEQEAAWRKHVNQTLNIVK